MKKYCDVCKSKLSGKIISLGNQPLCDDLKKIKSIKKNKLFKIDLRICKKCLTVNQLHKIKQETLFPKKYNYRAGLTQDVKNGMINLVSKVDKLINKKSKTVLDIGCNDGTLLNFFEKKNYKTFGIEPTNAFKDCSKKHVIFNKYFNNDTVKKILKRRSFIDVVTFTNVFAHITNFDQLINDLKMLVKNVNYLVIENHYLGSILEKNQFDTFYQEHPRTYSVKSFIFISKLIDMNLEKIEFPKRYGGNIRVYFSHSKKKYKISKILKKEKDFIKKFNKLDKKINYWKLNKSKIIKGLINKNYKIFGKAFPGRASILINLLNFDKNIISCIFEQDNSPKNFHYVPGTKIPILPDQNMKKLLKKDSIILNFAWHIKYEIKKYLRKKGIKNKIIDILSNKDFKKI